MDLNSHFQDGLEDLELVHIVARPRALLLRDQVARNLQHVLHLRGSLELQLALSLLRVLVEQFDKPEEEVVKLQIRERV